MAIQPYQMCTQEESGVGVAFLRIRYDDVSNAILTAEFQNTTSRSCFVAATDPSTGNPVAGMNRTMAAGTAFSSVDITGSGFQMQPKVGAHGRVGLAPPFGCYMRWPA